jgi:predicted deacylase
VLEQTLFSGVRGPRTSVGLAGERFRIPSLTIEVGGAGFDAHQEHLWRTKNIEAALAVMRHLRMIPGEPTHLDRYLYIRDYWRVTPRCGGYLEVLVGLDRQLTDVGPADLLGRVIDPATFEVLDELRSPGRGVLFHACRSSMVRPGAWGFGVARFEGAKAQWYSYRRGDVGPWRVDPGRLA